MKRTFEFTDELTHAGTETPRGGRCRETGATAENVLARHLQGDPSRFGHSDGDTVWQSKESLLRGLRNPRAFYSGCFEDGKLVGMVSAGKIDEGILKIFQLYVLPSHQRRGIGSRLMDAAIEHFKGAGKVVLDVEDGNQKGISFYSKYGFTYEGRTVVKIGGEEIPCLLGELHL